MNVGVLTSGFFHLFLGILLLLNIEKSISQKREVVQSVKVAFISEAYYTKAISENEIKESKALEIEKGEIVKPESEKKQPEVFEENNT